MIETQKTETWQIAGWAGVDSGRLMLIDPGYLEDMPEKFLTDPVDADGTSGWMVGEQCIAMIVATPFGDGLYPVHVVEDAEGRIISVRVDFTREARTAAHDEAERAIAAVEANGS
jgi:hypothetical protein